MIKTLTQPIALLLTALVALLTIAWQASVSATTEDATAIAAPVTIATAPSPPSLVPAILNGEPVQVLYITRSEDTVLVRCYPGYEPSLSVSAMSGNPADGGQQQGFLTCTRSQS